MSFLRTSGQSHSPQQPASCDAKSPTGAVYIFACVARTAAASPNVEKLMNRCGAVTRWWNVSSASPPRTSSTPGAPASAPKSAAGELLAEVRRDGVQFRGVALVDVGPDVDEDYAREPPGGDEGQPGQAETPERAP